MQFSTPIYALWIGVISLKVVGLALVLRSKAFRHAPFLSAYLFLTALQSILWWWLVQTQGADAPFMYYLYWGMESVVLFARGAAVADICRDLLKPYEGIWGFARIYLMGSAAILIVYAGLASVTAGNWIGPRVTRAKQGLELAVLLTVVLLLLFCRYYQLPFQGLSRSLALGFGFYSAVQAILNSLPAELLRENINWYRIADMTTYFSVLVVWCLALRKPLPVPPRAPVLLNVETYDAVTATVNLRLKDLNERLLRMFST